MEGAAKEKRPRGKSRQKYIKKKYKKKHKSENEITKKMSPIQELL